MSRDPLVLQMNSNIILSQKDVKEWLTSHMADLTDGCRHRWPTSQTNVILLYNPITSQMDG